MKNYTITVNGSVYDVVVEEGASTGAAPVAKSSSYRQHQRQLRKQQLRQVVQDPLRSKQVQQVKYSRSKQA